MIARAISLQTFQRRCILLVDNCNFTGHECDVLGVTPCGRIIDIEIKISRADLKKDQAKEKWWHRPGYFYGQPRPDPVVKAHPPRVWKHYYAMPADIWDDSLIECLPSKASGVLLLSWRPEARTINAPIIVTCRRRSTPAKDAYRLTAADTINVARLANLRMWEAYRAAYAKEDVNG